MAIILLVQIISFDYNDGNLNIFKIESTKDIFKQQITYDSSFELNSIICHRKNHGTIDQGHSFAYLKDNIKNNMLLC